MPQTPSTSPLFPTTSSPGHGTIHLSLLPPTTLVLKTLSYQYPLKLVAPAPLTSVNGELIYTVFLLSYGGGLVAGDTINLGIALDPSTKLILLTQGSTKIFKTPSPSKVSRQTMRVDLASGSALCYLPDPVQPFEASAFEQRQIYNLQGEEASLCVCDWVNEGRTARGEKWRVWRYGSRNEVYLRREEGNMRLLLRDNLVLDEDLARTEGLPDFAARMDGLGVFGTLIIIGPVFEGLGRFFIDEFGKIPRIGARNWGDEDPHHVDETEVWRNGRLRQEAKDGLLWTAANVRGFVLVKFGATEVEGVKRWLRGMVKFEGSIEKAFGERASHCLK